MQKNRLTTSKPMKNHPIHTMKKQSISFEEIVVKGSSVNKKQKRTVIRYACVCKEEDIFYRQSDHSDLFFEEYSKPAKK